jgi:hypothetical protein
MSGGNDRRDSSHPREFAVLRSPGSGVGRPEEEHESIGTTQTNSGLAVGDPAGGPQRTPERRAFDEARGHEPQVKSADDPDLHPRDDEHVQAPTTSTQRRRTEIRWGRAQG